MEGRRAQWDRQTAADRLRRATQWRRARDRMRGYLAPVRSALHAHWQQCRWPADPEYLLTMLHMYDTGRLSLPDTSTSTSN